jgi:hypothetical protein
LSLPSSPYGLANFFEEVVVQVLICFVGGMAFQVTRMGGKEWAISLALGFISLPLGALIRCIPNEPVERLFVKLRMLPKQEVLPTTHPDAQPGMSFAMDQVRDNLGTFAKLRGGRMRGSSFVRKSRSAGPDNPDGPRLVYVFTTSHLEARSIDDSVSSLDLHYWRWSLRWWLPTLLHLTGSLVLAVRSLIPLASIHQSHRLLSGRISSKFIRTHCPMILCSEYSA